MKEFSYLPCTNFSHVIQPNLDPSPELAYALGVICGDGWVAKHRHKSNGGHEYGIYLKVTDETFAKEFHKTLGRLGLHPRTRLFSPEREKRKAVYKVVAYSVNFYRQYIDGGSDWIRYIAQQFPVDFLRGFYESEGSLKKIARWDRRSPLKFRLAYSYRLAVSNTNKELLELTEELLSNQGIRLKLWGPYYKGEKAKPLYHLSTNKQSDISHFLEVVKPCIRNNIEFEHKVHPREFHKTWPAKVREAKRQAKLLKETMATS